MDSSPPLPPADDDLLIMEYVPAFRDAKDWRPTFRQQRRGAGGTVVRRVVWENNGDSRNRLLVDVAEALTGRAAASRVADEERDSNVPLERGPIDHLGPRSLSYPPIRENPSSQTIRVANLAIWVFSCGGKLFDVTEWVEAIQRELEVEKTASRNADVVLTPDQQPHDSPGRAYLRFSLQWERGDWAWWKFKAFNATLEKAPDNRVILTSDGGKTEPSVTAWAVEPGREAYWGRYP